MKALISASNELPAKDQGLEALWDRFLVRLIVDGIEDREKFNAMITMPQNLFDEKVDGGITDNEYEDWSKKIDQIAIPENVSNVIHVIRNKIKLHNQNEENAEKQIYVSDRRWRKIVRLMRTSAFVNHRSEVDLMDCFLIKHCIWNEESQIQTVSGFVNDAIRDYGPNLDMNLHTEREEFNKLKAEIEKNTSKKVGDKPKIYTDNNKTNYYRLKQPFENKYFLIESNIVDKITENSTRTTIFIDDFTENTSCYIKESSDEKNSILLSTREVYPEWDEWQTYELETEQVFELYKKPPSRGDFELWNKETKKLLDVLDEKKTEAEQYWGKFSGNFYDNIFVEKKNADDQIKSKIDTVILDIKEFRKEIEDICKKYQSIYKP
jgi:MoxR-like ATPase